jgi:hypothetical protein
VSGATHIQRCRQWLGEQLEAMGTLRTANSRDLSFKSWRQNTVTVLQRIWPGNREVVERFRRIVFTPPQSRPDPRLTRDWFGRGIAESRTYLQSLLDQIDRDGVPAVSDGDHDRDAKDLEDEVGFPMLDLTDSGEVRMPSHAPESASAPSIASGDLDVTVGYTTPDEQGVVPHDPVSPLPPSLMMQWRVPAAFALKRPAVPASPAPPALGESSVESGEPRETEVRPEVEIPRAPSLPPAEKPAPPVAAKPAVPVDETPPAPAAAKPAVPAAAKPVAPVAAKPAVPVVPTTPKPVAPVAAKPATPVVPTTPKPVAPVAAKPATPVVPTTPKPVAPVAAKPATPVVPSTPQPVEPVAAMPSSPAVPGTPVPAQGRVDTSPPERRETGARGKNGRARIRKAGPKPRLKDLLGLGEFETRTHEAEAALTRATPAAPPAPPATPPPVAVAPLAPVAEKAGPEPEEEDAEGNRERATLDFMQNSPVFGVVGRPVQRRTDTTEFLDPDAVAVATLAAELGRLGVPEGMKSSLASRLTDVARHLDEGEIGWALLRGSVTDAMQYPELARRLLPVLLPWLERAA